MEDLLLTEKKFSPFVTGFSKYTTVLPLHSRAQASKSDVRSYKFP